MDSEVESRPPRVTVVVPAYNASGYIGPTLASARAQTVGDIEIIVVDDCSTDDTQAVVSELAEADSRIRYIRSPRNFGGPAGPRNIGVREARGAWIAFLDSDDIWHPRKLEWQLEALAETGLKFCSTKIVNFEDETELRLPEENSGQTLRITFHNELVRNRIPTLSVLVSKALINSVMFVEDRRYAAREDHDCWLHCHEIAGDSLKLLTPLVGYRVSAQQLSGKKLTMMKRHFFVLNRYRRTNGKTLGSALAGWFTATHFTLSLYYRLILREL